MVSLEVVSGSSCSPSWAKVTAGKETDVLSVLPKRKGIHMVFYGNRADRRTIHSEGGLLEWLT